MVRRIGCNEDEMTKTLSASAAALLAGLLALSLSASSAEAAKKRYASSSVVYGNSRSMNSSYMAGPRTRVFVTKRSWLDLGTEVSPGERHFSDYAIPPGNNNIDMLTPQTDWRRKPVDVWDLPGVSKNGYPFNNF